MSALGGLGIGLFLLLFGGTLVVKGASGIAERLGISPLVVGLTIVAFGTSAPELAVNIIGALRHETELAFGNVVGSNIANLGLVLGLASLCRKIEIHGQIVRREVPLLLLATAVIFIMASDVALRSQPAEIDRAEGLILFLLFGLFLYVSIQDVLTQPSTDSLLTEMEAAPLVGSAPARSRDVTVLIVGFVALLAGGHMTVTQGVELAELLGVPSAVVGLFIVGVGTSLPELVTSVIAAVRGESDLAVGNVVGSNLFNGLCVLPISTMVRPIEAPTGGLLDLFVSLLFALALLPVFWFGRAHMGRLTGLAFVSAYLAYAVLRMNSGH